MGFDREEVIDLTERWLVSGDLDPKILGEKFQFISPFWKSSTKEEFIEKFHSSIYKETSLSKIRGFDPIIKMKSLDQNYFSIILQYHTKNGQSVWEAVLGKISEGYLVELRSIYDLEETKKALEL